MKKYFFVSGLVISLFTITAFAQPGSDVVPVPDKFLTAANKDTAYSRFKAQVNSWIQKANGRNSFAAEVSSLFESNKPMLTRIYQQYDLAGSLDKKRSATVKQKIVKMNPAIAKPLPNIGTIGLIKNIGPPNVSYWHYVDLINANTIKSEFQSSNTGEYFFSVLQSTYWSPSLKQSHAGFLMDAVVPDNPNIIAARVSFEYSFYYTGWDTYGSKSGIQLVLGANKLFVSPTFQAWTDTAVFIPGINQDKTKFNIIDVFMPFDSVGAEIAEMHVSKEGSFTVDGYVKPKDYLYFKIGAGYMQGSQFGINGHYLYGEFRLKKVTITYLKSITN